MSANLSWAGDCLVVIKLVPILQDCCCVYAVMSCCSGIVQSCAGIIGQIYHLNRKCRSLLLLARLPLRPSYCCMWTPFVLDKLDSKMLLGCCVMTALENARLEGNFGVSDQNRTGLSQLNRFWTPMRITLPGTANCIDAANMTRHLCGRQGFSSAW